MKNPFKRNKRTTFVPLTNAEIRDIIGENHGEINNDLPRLHVSFINGKGQRVDPFKATSFFAAYPDAATTRDAVDEIERLAAEAEAKRVQDRNHARLIRNSMYGKFTKADIKATLAAYGYADTDSIHQDEPQPDDIIQIVLMRSDALELRRLLLATTTEAIIQRLPEAEKSARKLAHLVSAEIDAQ